MSFLFSTAHRIISYTSRCRPQQLLNSGLRSTESVCKPRWFMKHLFHIKVEVDTRRMWTDSSKWIIFAAETPLKTLTFFTIPSLGQRTQLGVCFLKDKTLIYHRGGVRLTCCCGHDGRHPVSPQNIWMDYAWVKGVSPLLIPSFM